MDQDLEADNPSNIDDDQSDEPPSKKQCQPERLESLTAYIDIISPLRTQRTKETIILGRPMSGEGGCLTVLYSSKILRHRYKLVVEIHKVSAMNSLSQPSSQSRREHSLRSTLILGFTIRYVQVELRCSSEKSDYLFRILPTFYIWTLGKKKNTFPLLSGSAVKHSQNKLKWLGRPADRHKTSPENTAGAFRLKMCIR